MESKVFCQSCAMPLEKPEDFGTERDGPKSADYCQHCFVNGAFTLETTMEGMIDLCVPYTVEAGVYPTAEAARAEMRAFFPTLKRWAGK